MNALISRVRTIGPDEQITRPGVYNVPIERYHGDPDLFPGHSVSSTGLRRILEKSPKHYWAHCVHNPDRIPHQTSEALRFGKAVHAFLLERDLPSNEFAIHKFKNFNTNEGVKLTEWEETVDVMRLGKPVIDKETGKIKTRVVKKKAYIDKHKREYTGFAAYKKAWKFCADWAGLTIVGEDDIEIFRKMALELSKDPMVQKGILEGEIETTIAWQDPETGIWVKIRPDVVPTDSILADYKTTVSAHPRKISKAISDYGYDMQLALGMEGIARVLGKVIDTAVLVCQEKVEPYVPQVAPLNNNTLWLGARQNRKALDLISECLKEGRWRGYSDGPETVGHTKYKYDQLMQDAEDGNLPDIAGTHLTDILGIAGPKKEKTNG